MKTMILVALMLAATMAQAVEVTPMEPMYRVDNSRVVWEMQQQALEENQRQQLEAQRRQNQLLEQMLRQQQQQQLRHGAGGCTPNFVTGGCL